MTVIPSKGGSGTVADLASQAEAEAGVENTHTMTPLRTAQAIDALAGNTFKKDNVVTVADSNIALFDEQTINGVVLVADDRVLLTAQTDASENGLWVVVDGPSVAWTRPTDFATGSEAEGAWTHIEQGTLYDESIWFCVTNGACVVDTDNQEWRNVNEDDADGFNISELTEDSTSASGDYIAKHDGSGMEKIKRNDFIRPGVQTLTDGATVTIDLSDPERVFSVELGGNRTLAIVNANAGDRFLLKIEQDGTGSRTVTWFDTINWEGGSAPTLTTTADKSDYFEFICTATNTYDCILQTQNLATAAGAATALGDDILYYWDLAESNSDRTDEVASLVLSQTNSVLSTTGKNGDCAVFDGVNEYLSHVFSHGSDLDFEDTDFSIAVWVNFDTVASNQYIIHAPKFSVYLSASQAKIFFACDGLATAQIPTVSTVSGSTWYLIVCAHDSAADLLKISINGGAYETIALTGGLDANGGGTMYVGALGGGAQYLDGKLDELGFWSKALSAAEVTDLYNSGTGKFYPFT